MMRSRLSVTVSDWLAQRSPGHGCHLSYHNHEVSAQHADCRKEPLTPVLVAIGKERRRENGVRFGDEVRLQHNDV